MKSTAVWPGFSLTVDHDVQWMEPGLVRDPNWRHVDGEGHGHFVDRDLGLPTLEWVSEPCTMGHGEDCDSEGRWQCRLCGEQIHPGRKQGDPIRVDGLTTYTLTASTDDGERTYVFNEDEWGRVNEAVGQAVHAVLSDRLVSHSATG